MKSTTAQTTNPARQARLNNPGRTARTAYFQHQNEVGEKIEKLQKLMIDHAMKLQGNLDMINWADVGDIAKVNAELTDLIEFLK